jgi:hypothetical protein
MISSFVSVVPTLTLAMLAMALHGCSTGRGYGPRSRHTGQAERRVRLGLLGGPLHRHERERVRKLSRERGLGPAPRAVRTHCSHSRILSPMLSHENHRSWAS